MAKQKNQGGWWWSSSTADSTETKAAEPTVTATKTEQKQEADTTQTNPQNTNDPVKEETQTASPKATANNASQPSTTSNKHVEDYLAKIAEVLQHRRMKETADQKLKAAAKLTKSHEEKLVILTTTGCSDEANEKRLKELEEEKQSLNAKITAEKTAIGSHNDSLKQSEPELKFLQDAIAGTVEQLGVNETLLHKVATSSGETTPNPLHLFSYIQKLTETVTHLKTADTAPEVHMDLPVAPIFEHSTDSDM